MGKRNKSRLSDFNSSVSMMSLKYNILDPIVEDIYNNCVKLNEEETTALKERFRIYYGLICRLLNLPQKTSLIEALKEVIEKYVEIMKEVDPTFKAIFNKINYVGSFYDGLMINEATEFDLNLVLKPNFTMKLLRKRRPAGFIAIKVEQFSTLLLPAACRDWITNNDFLNPNAVRWWFQSVATKALNKLEEEGKLIHGCELKLRQSGPAWTLTVSSQEPPRKTIDIDLVPVLEFSTCPELINPPLKKKYIQKKLDFTKPWFVVPKPPASNCPCLMCISWRMSFPIQESAMIQDLHFFKYTLRLVKKVRDVLEIHEVASYYIKNLFLLELVKNGPEQWTRNSRGYLFIHMLDCLISALENGRIPFVWNHTCNLIGKVNRDYLRNSANLLRRYRDHIEQLVEKKDHDTLKSVIQSLLNQAQD